MRLTAQDWEWLGEQAGLTPLKRRIMIARYVDDVLPEGIAAAEDIAPRTVQWHLHQSWVRLQTHAWPEDLKDFVAVLMEINERDYCGQSVPASCWEEAQRLLWCHRNRMPGGNAPPALVDERGRKIVGVPVVTAEDLLKTKRLTA